MIQLLATKAARQWFKDHQHMAIIDLSELYIEALRIARQRKATRLGKIHCELALQKLDEQARSQ